MNPFGDVKTMIENPTVEAVPAVATAMIHLTVAREDMPKVMGPAFGELFGALAAQGIAPEGPAFDYHLREDRGVFDFQLSVPVGREVAPVGRVQAGSRPASPRVARTVYHGPYEGLPDAWGSFMRWISEQGHTPAGTFWQVYSVGPGQTPDPAQWRTELCRPLV